MMSYPYEHMPSYSWSCPYCGEPDQEGEDLGDHPAYLSFECAECGRAFAVDNWKEEYYDDKGGVIKPCKGREGV